jgi:integrase/recombinase XerD
VNPFGRKDERRNLSFALETVTTTTHADYQIYLQQEFHLKPNSVNRNLIRLKWYFAGQYSMDNIKYGPSKVVKLIEKEVFSPHHLDDQVEQRLLTIVMETGNPRNRAIIVLILYTEQRTRELGTLTPAQVRLGKRSGIFNVGCKYDKYREILLNATIRVALLAYDLSLQKPQSSTNPLFLSEKRLTELTEYGLSYVIKKYANRAKISDLSSHDLRHHFG